MPVVRKLVIFAAVDGLILQPHSGRQAGYHESSALQIDYRTRNVSVAGEKRLAEDSDGLESYGLIGLLPVASYSFLISISQRTQVAQIHGKPVYAVTDVALIPLSSRAEATHAIAQAREHLEDTDYSEEEDEEANVGSLPGSPTREVAVQSPLHTRSQSTSGGIAEDVIGKKVPFGRFAASWLSRKALGLSASGLSVDGSEDSDNDRLERRNERKEDKEKEILEEETDIPAEGGLPSVELLPKLLRYTRLLFASNNFFFAHEYDLTRQIGVFDSSRSPLPLHKAVDPVYFWNRHLMSPFIDAGAHGFVLPLIQGFVGQREFTVAAKPKEEGKPVEGEILGENEAQPAADALKRNFLLTLISRRSVKRPGLRYLRRGVDDDGNTANFVETEQILSDPGWDTCRDIYSFLQIRGSIPLYFSQSPYAFKPVPTLYHPAETNQIAFDRHFRTLGRRYGRIQAVSLVDKSGGELKIGEQYEKYAEALNASGGIEGSPLGLVWFDFHHECRGMKFENVRRLVDGLGDTLDQFGYTVISDNAISQSQTGIVRTNCMDCLDRTGVAQCAFGGWALEQALGRAGLAIDLHNDPSTQWFNTIWADNGDAISKQYSSTAALKGDYTRTRKRNYRGALNDFALTLSRYYNNLVNDYFSQACIDYLLGNVSTRVFGEFAAEMQSADPGISVQKLRQNAIETSCKIVIDDQAEDFLGGWTMLTPREPSTLRSLPFEEAVLLLTDAAVYSCRFDWNTDKVLSFERIDLRHIAHITYGTYITSILTDRQTDEADNVGLLLLYREGDAHALRVNTRSLQSSASLPPPPSTTANFDWDISSWLKNGGNKNQRFLAFKALPLATSVLPGAASSRHPRRPTVRQRDFVRSICEEIERAMRACQEPPHAEGPSVIDEADIISLAEAKKRTGYFEHLVYDIKKMVWA
ncbi:hypothetical protein ASPZODRAFT_2108733 [Penicilliopsis zonata CBS 506.65]|uniref:SAC domain-containing protein n=1 Tax=Penicilliopsis zonata CBS 506.65 TaxID=1073090 RepID=A0A1L9SEV0_9EURO|nr:hypothetical protein ASPZODRAFT_2108733 [Penicilliopsis zonata CBS 506.65]OJJ45711.1 hypothetical protein ASPZODRAFT_2108733 [Penicilliopsis zonata CBS 506.65]